MPTFQDGGTQRTCQKVYKHPSRDRGTLYFSPPIRHHCRSSLHLCCRTPVRLLPMFCKSVPPACGPPTTPNNSLGSIGHRGAVVRLHGTCAFPLFKFSTWLIDPRVLGSVDIFGLREWPERGQVRVCRRWIPDGCWLARELVLTGRVDVADSLVHSD